MLTWTPWSTDKAKRHAAVDLGDAKAALDDYGSLYGETTRISVFLRWSPGEKGKKHSISLLPSETRRLYEALREAYGDNA